jgi:hypothetical protein
VLLLRLLHFTSIATYPRAGSRRVRYPRSPAGSAFVSVVRPSSGARIDAWARQAQD